MGLINRWRLQDNDSNTTAASSMFGQNLGNINNRMNSAFSNADGPNANLPRSFLLDGTSDYLTSLSQFIRTAPNPFSVGIWCKRSTTTNRSLITIGSSTVDWSYVFGYMASSTIVRAKIGSDKDFTTGALGTGWVHLGFTVDASKDVRVFLNGTQVGAAQNDASYSGNRYLRALGGSGVQSVFWDGKVCDLTIFDYDLSAADWSLVMAGGLGAVNTVAPTITGTFAEGGTLVANIGTWTDLLSSYYYWRYAQDDGTGLAPDENTEDSWEADPYDGTDLIIPVGPGPQSGESMGGFWVRLWVNGSGLMGQSTVVSQWYKIALPSSGTAVVRTLLGVG